MLPAALLNSPALGITITLGLFAVARFIQLNTRFKSIPPMVTATCLIISLLLILDIDYPTYNKGGEMISFLLGPATIALALPLVKNIKILLNNLKPILIGVFTGSIVAILSVAALAKLLGASTKVMLSLVPKSVTTPIAMGIAQNIGGIPALTAIMVILTGMLGAFCGHKLLKLCGVKADIAIGIAIGAAAHGLGANRCLSENELQAAVAGVAIALVGIVTALLAPTLSSLFI